MVQLQRMDARLDTLSIQLYQVNVCISHIAQRQAIIGGFAPEAFPPPPPMASDSKAEDDDDGDASSTDKIST